MEGETFRSDNGSDRKQAIRRSIEQARRLNSPHGYFGQSMQISKSTRIQQSLNNNPNSSKAKATQRNIALRISPATTNTSSNVEIHAMRRPSRSIAMPS
jgi:hypothetical protein